ncbi:hypothetical protein [Pediococcus acidilactici]|uniref:hypothetical protein n=1 Tax=Pediococcus acidilactici TaxID=1254 RepID=UPI00155E6DF7|nr:hypothetical protein [Pediococcus acidilactici]NRD14242.1 hypothetical protein [Pediococcus acidilactici]
MKKSMLAALIAFGFITPILTNTGASAAEFNQNEPNASAIIQKINQQQQKLPRISEKQLKIQDSDIETWMPNPTVRELMLEMLIEHGYLPEDSTVNDITKDLLGSVRDYDLFYFNINTFAGGQITSNLTEGLQYVNSKAKITMEIFDANESQLMQIDFAQLHQNLDQWSVYVINPQQIANPQLAQKVIDAKLPSKNETPRQPFICYVRATYTNNETAIIPSPTKSIDISKALYPTINLTTSDFWKEIDLSKYAAHATSSALINNDNFLVTSSFYIFKEVSEGDYLGTLSEKEETIRAMEEVANNPQNYYGWFANSNIYNDNQHQLISLVSIIYADFHK